MEIRLIQWLRSIIFISCLFFLACGNASTADKQSAVASIEPNSHPSPKPHIPMVDGFDFPVGPPNAKGYYNAQSFGKNLHLGDDWNGVGGGNSDLGDPVYSIAHGLVVEAEDHGGGWGKVIRIIHQVDESLYAHLDTILVEVGDLVERGDPIGTIGNADGAYWAHLHLEIRSEVGLPLGGGYNGDTEGYLDPTVFIEEHRLIER